jgi:hypothetical protein
MLKKYKQDFNNLTLQTHSNGKKINYEKNKVGKGVKQ